MLVSPAEPEAFRALGEVSVRTEELGVDFLYVTERGLVGVQRKEYNDLLGSIFNSDRLYKELQQMRALDLGIFLIEGKPQWTSDQTLLSIRQWTFPQHLGLLCSMQSQGYWIFYTATHQESMWFLSGLPKWLEKGKHNSLNTREKPKSDWGFLTNQDWACHLLQSFPNIGPETARNIVKYFGGVPLRWDVTVKELEQVPGVGKVRARKMWDAINGGENEPADRIVTQH